MTVDLASLFLHALSDSQDACEHHDAYFCLPATTLAGDPSIVGIHARRCVEGGRPDAEYQRRVDTVTTEWWDAHNRETLWIRTRPGNPTTPTLLV